MAYIFGFISLVSAFSAYSIGFDNGYFTLRECAVWVVSFSSLVLFLEHLE